jgi:hypothetical protein
MDIKEKNGAVIIGEHRFLKTWLKSTRLQQVLRICKAKPKDVVTEAWNYANGIKTTPTKSSTKSKTKSSKKSDEKG